MSQIYLSLPGSKLRLKNGRYLVTLRDEILLETPAEGIQEVILLGGTQITTQAMRHLLTHQARLHLLTQEERHIGTLEPTQNSKTDTLRAQVRQTDRLDWRLQTAKLIVMAKLENTRIVLQRLARDHPSSNLAQEASEFQRLAMHSVETAQTENEVRGYEGIAAQAHFAVLSEIIPAHWQFSTRERRPPPDPINAMLSFGYTLLLTRIISALQSAGLHIGIGCLHVSHGTRPALALDLMEEYRAALVDRFVLNIALRELLKPSDFMQTTQGCRFSSQARDHFIRLWEARIQTTIQHQEKTLTYARLIRQQAKDFAAYTRLETQTYQPLRIR
jgi:CRISP-associated protein Cas1